MHDAMNNSRSDFFRNLDSRPARLAMDIVAPPLIQLSSLSGDIFRGDVGAESAHGHIELSASPFIDPG